MVFTSFLTRFYKWIVAAQQKRADRQVALHRHLLPRDLEATGDKLIHRNEDALPFGR
ncbi:MAG TPA: hypothetical protein VNQ56_04600 [Pseudolabrys sp.]|nr:hypothetical protein [Pseudolabrys sp.]